MHADDPSIPEPHPIADVEDTGPPPPALAGSGPESGVPAPPSAALPPPPSSHPPSRPPRWRAPHRPHWQAPLRHPTPGGELHVHLTVRRALPGGARVTSHDHRFP